MRDPSLSQVTGVLSPFAQEFDGWLERQGYAASSRAGHFRLMARLSVWLDERGLGPAVSRRVVDEFVAQRRSAGCREHRSVRALKPLLAYLGAAGATPSPEPVLGPAEMLLADYGRYLAGERGLSGSTIERNMGLVRPFLVEHVVDARGSLRSLPAAEVSGFMLACTQRVSPATVQRTATALRSLLAFLHVEGVVGESLVTAVPAAARWRGAGLPRYLTAPQVQAMLAACDRGTDVGRRDAAIVTVLARLGLRAGEAAGLRLEDIDWRRGEITVTGKGNRHERLPLPVDVGEAVVAYLIRSRPAMTEDRAVFVGARAPHQALTRGAVTQVVARAARRAGLGTIYAHRLRHTAATAMLAAGASLEEIGQVLRHRHVLTTAGYAKVDHDRLRELARPWPGERA